MSIGCACDRRVPFQETWCGQIQCKRQRARRPCRAADIQDDPATYRRPLLTPAIDGNRPRQAVRQSDDGWLACRLRKLAIFSPRTEPDMRKHQTVRTTGHLIGGDPVVRGFVSWDKCSCPGLSGVFALSWANCVTTGSAPSSVHVGVSTTAGLSTRTSIQETRGH
jgi:hypothetical protein